MSTIIVAAILIAGTILISAIFILINKKNERERIQKLLRFFNKAAASRGLSFSSQEVLRDKIFGIDAINKKLLVFQFADSDNVQCIDMEDVTNCTVTRDYDSVNIGSGNNGKTEKYLTSIQIKFDFKNNTAAAYLSFYNNSNNSIMEMAQLEAKAKDWAAILVKMILKEHKVRA